MHPTVSIVTITYNAAQIVEETILSVLSQSYTDYEYVFIDGKSKDGTLDRIEMYRQRFEDKGIPFRVYSEPDKGIYDALNKGIVQAQGQWIQMLNAGDRLAHENVLERVFQDRHYEADVVYGDTILSDSGYYKKRQTQTPDKLPYEMPFCHQSVFVRTSVQKKYRFNMQYRIVADYDMFGRMYLDGVSFRYIQEYVSIFDMTGLSGANQLALDREKDQSRRNNGILTEPQSDLKETARGFYYKLLKIRRNIMKKTGCYYTVKRGWHRSITDIR